MASVQDHGDSAGSPSPAPSHGPSPASSSQPQHQQSRILACVMCQQRKTKCNRKFPCHNCIRAGFSCVQATLNPRRRRRQFPERVLLDRVRTYESLLRKNNVHFEEFNFTETADGQPVEDAAAMEVTPPAEARSLRAQRSDNQDDGAPTIQSTAPKSRGTEAVNFWKAVRRGFGDRDRRNNDDAYSTSSDEAEIRNSVIRSPWQRRMGGLGNLLLRNADGRSGQSLQSLHPGPAQIFLLWQIFLSNVDALLKITHPPTLQKRIAEAANNLAGLDANLEALMFGIYCAAVHSMPPDECATTFGTSKRQLLAMYHAACEQALLNSGFLRTSDRECLSAFFLYMLSLGYRLDPRSMYAMLGVGTRIAKTMRLDQEAANARAPPLEGELRRRLWWALVLFDARISELAQSPPVLDPTWDCRVPANANDSDFRAGMKEPPPLSVAPAGMAYVSEAVFATVRAELGNALRHMEYYVALLNPALRHMVRRAPAPAAAVSAAMPDYGDIDAMEALVHGRFLQHCDADNGLHYMAIKFTRGMIAKSRLIKYFAQYSHLDGLDKSGDKSSASPAPPAPPSDTAEMESVMDRALDEALTVLESDTAIMTSRLTQPYSWLQSLYFPMPAYVLVTQDLAHRINGTRARDVWAAMHANYESRFAAFDSEDRHMFKTFAGIILQAWDQCDERGRAAGESQPVPALVVKIREDMAAETAASQAAAAGPDDAGMSTGLLDLGPGPGPGAVPASTPSIFGALGDGPGPAYASGSGVETSGVGIYPSPDIGSMGFSGLAGFCGIGGYSMPGGPAGPIWPPLAWSWASRPNGV